MYDLLGQIIIVKVFSHQLNPDFTMKSHGNTPSPNLFIVSAKQIADIAATMAHNIHANCDTQDLNQYYYPPFSPRWCFSSEGKLTNKGATKLLHNKIYEELVLRQQHCSKQGTYLCLAPYNSLITNQIGDESLLRNLIKMTAPCWTWCLSRYPLLVNQTWKYWRFLMLDKNDDESIPYSAPKNWKKDALIRDNIIKACPFCSRPDANENNIRNLEHLHIYCPSKFLVKTRDHCNQKLEIALQKLYNFAYLREFNMQLSDNTQSTMLQENMIMAAKDAELQERPDIRFSKVVYEKRTTNQAIKSCFDVQLAVLLNKLPATKLDEFIRFPLSSQLGFMHAIPEQDFNTATATVTDVGFIGLFPKCFFKQCANMVEKLKDLMTQEVQIFMISLLPLYIVQ